MKRLNSDQVLCLVEALKAIAEHKSEASEWQGTDFFVECVRTAQRALESCRIKFTDNLLE